MKERSRLIKMHIKNIGCIGNDGLTVELDNIVCLVGKNNSGKTTVLRAYELAVKQLNLNEGDLNICANGQLASVELWVHIPETAGNIDEKWKEQDGNLRLVRSKWEWPGLNAKPKRTTWDPKSQEYAEDGKASGLDAVFNSRLPQPFRIGSLEDPKEEHKKLLTLVLEPISNQLKLFMDDPHSEFQTKINELKKLAEKPVSIFKQQVEKVEAQVSTSYKKVFNSSEIKLTVELGDLRFDPLKSLVESSCIDIVEKHGNTKWDQQGTGSQRALFWSILQVRSELGRQAELKKQRDKDSSELIKLKEKVSKNAKDTTKIAELERKLASPENPSENNDSDIFLPGYMLLIDEPETALHPSAVRAAKEHLYELASEPGWQVMLSTHHPAFIDPLKDHTTIVRLHRSESHFPPNIYRSEDMQFEQEEINNLKALLAFDQSVSEIFFSNKILIVEGDTEFGAFNEILNSNTAKYALEKRPLIIRARGKATIPILIKILTHFKISFALLHDIDLKIREDGGTNSAYSMNNKISELIKNARETGLTVNYKCSCPNFETHHNMDLPSKDKPYKAWNLVRTDPSVRLSVEKMLTELLENEDDTLPDGIDFEQTLASWESQKTEIVINKK